MSGTVIQVQNVWKEYHLGVISHRTLARDLQSWWAKVRGKDDPNTKICLPGIHNSISADRFWAVKDVSFQVKQGEVIGIIGRNGAGKSTLLKILSRVTAPTRGEVRFKGRIASLLEVGTGFHPDLTGRENVFLNGAILGMTRDEIRSKFDEIVAFAEVEKFIDTPVKRYSSGMYVRLAFAVAAHLEPEILIIDEVLAVGDINFQNKCLKKMNDVATSNRTILFVSHNMSSIRRLCTRALWLDSGEIKMEGDASDVVAAYQNQVFSENFEQVEWFTRSDREWPARETWVTAVQLQNDRGEACTRYAYGDSMRILFRLEGKPAREGTSLAWILSDARGANIAWSNSVLTSGFALKEGANGGTCLLPNLPLAKGRYSLSFSCGIVGSSEPKDLWKDAANFEITSCDPFHNKAEHVSEPFGGVVIQHSWFHDEHRS